MLVNMKLLLEHARDNNYIVAAPNVWNDWSTRAAIDAAIELNSPLILDADFNSNIYIWMDYAKKWAENAPIPIAINLDHGASFDQTMVAINAGFTSVMLDKSYEPFEKNLAEVKAVVEIAKISDVSVEAELGYVGDAADADNTNEMYYTDPKKVKEFVERTGVDCLAVSVGTAHGKYKDGIIPKINFELIKEIENECNIPLVLHGGSGTPMETLKRLALETNISKVNIFTDIHEYILETTSFTKHENIPLYEMDGYYYHAYKEKLKEFIQVLNSENRVKSIAIEMSEYYEGGKGIR